MVSRDDLVSCYRILGLAPGASLESVRQAYKGLVRNWHPDQFMNDESMRRMAERHMRIINSAHKTLSEFLRFRTPFHFEEKRGASPRNRAEGDQRGHRRHECAVSRFRARTTAAWRVRFRFSFEDVEFFGPSVTVFFKTMCYGAIAWALFIGSFAAVEGLQHSTSSFLANEFSLAARMAFFWMLRVVVLEWGEIASK